VVIEFWSWGVPSSSFDRYGVGLFDHLVGAVLRAIAFHTLPLW
jgi:hypothetical protein